MKVRPTKRRRTNRGSAKVLGRISNAQVGSSNDAHRDGGVAGEYKQRTQVVQGSDLRSVVDRSVARSGLTYEGFVRHITRGALGSLKFWTESDLERLLLTCERLRLDPLGREVYCTEAQDTTAEVGTQGRPPLVVVALEGWCRIINSHPQFDGMSFEESAELEGGLPVWVECSMHRKDRRVATTVREYMCETRTEQSAWLTHPRRMLRHKALVQCARICFGLSGIYDPDEAQRIRAALALTKENSPSRTPRGNPARPSGTPGTPGTSAHKEGGEEASGQAAKTAHSKPRGAESIKQWIEKNCTT